MAREARDRSAETTPSRMAETTPPGPPPDYGVHMMHSILEMQRALGGLENAVKNLDNQSKEDGNKLDQIGKDVHAAKVVIGVVGTLIILAAGFLGWAITTYLSAHATH